MGVFAKGKRSLAISDRSGMAFPYTEMVREWNGSLVHTSEFEPKHPQIRRKRVVADAIALQNSRAQDFQQPEVPFQMILQLLDQVAKDKQSLILHYLVSLLFKYFTQ